MSLNNSGIPLTPRVVVIVVQLEISDNSSYIKKPVLLYNPRTIIINV